MLTYSLSCGGQGSNSRRKATVYHSRAAVCRVAGQRGVQVQLRGGAGSGAGPRAGRGGACRCRAPLWSVQLRPGCPAPALFSFGDCAGHLASETQGVQDSVAGAQLCLHSRVGRTSRQPLGASVPVSVIQHRIIYADAMTLPFPSAHRCPLGGASTEDPWEERATPPLRLRASDHYTHNSPPFCAKR